MTILRMTEEEWVAARGVTTGDAESSRTAATDAAHPHIVQDRLFDLRDYFAGQALPAALTQEAIGDDGRPCLYDIAIVARNAYELADAMLTERAKEKS